MRPRAGCPDPTVDGLYEAALDEIGGEGLDAGWHPVAARLRQVILDHASEIDCDCGEPRNGSNESSCTTPATCAIKEEPCEVSRPPSLRCAQCASCGRRRKHVP